MLDVKNVNKNVSACPAETGSCENNITIFHCKFPDVMFSTKNKTLYYSEWDGIEVDAKTKEVTDKQDATHYDLVTSVRYGTSFTVDACLAENAGLKAFILDNTIGSGDNKATVSFMNGFRVKIENPITDNVTGDTRINTYSFKAILSSLGGLLGADEESKNETEMEFQLYGSPEVFGASNGMYYSDKKVPKVAFEVVAGTVADSLKVSNAVISNKAELCEVVDTIEVQYFAEIENSPGCSGIVDNQWLPIAGLDGNSVKTIHVDALPQESGDFAKVQIVDTTIKKVYAVINLNGVATIVGMAEPTLTTKTVK
jgi:hypothetical protein